MVDPLVASIVVILGKYALDKGVELGKEVGPKALDTAKEVFSLVLDRLRQEPAGQTIADGYEQDPEVWEKPLAQTLDVTVQADPAFAAQLQALQQAFDQQAGAHAAETGRTYTATVTGDGAAAQDHSAAAGKGGIAVGGDATIKT